MKSILAYILIFCMTSHANVTIEVKKQFMKDINACFIDMNKKDFLLEMQYSMYNGKVEGKPIETSRNKIAKLKNNLYTENDLVTSYSNKKYQASIYHKDKVVLINKSKKNEKLKMEQILMSDSNMWSTFSSISLLSDSLNIRTYKILFLPSSPIASFQMSIDNKNKIIKRNIMTYNPKYSSYLLKGTGQKDLKGRDKPILVIEYINQQVLRNNDEALFYCKDIKLESQGEVKLLNKLSSFKKYNYLKDK